MTDTNKTEQEPRSGLSDLTVKLGDAQDMPEGCVCNPFEWFGKAKQVCDDFVSDEGHDQCKHCEHCDECHKAPTYELSGSDRSPPRMAGCASTYNGDKKMVLASELIKKLSELVSDHGDHPVMVYIADDGAYEVELPKFDTDGAGDDCYII